MFFLHLLKAFPLYLLNAVQYIYVVIFLPGILNCSRPDVSVMDALFSVRQHFRNKDKPVIIISYVGLAVDTS